MSGGFGMHRIPLETADEIDLTNGSMRTLQKLPKTDYNFGCCVFKGLPYVISDAIYVYKEDAWMRMGRLTIRDIGHAVADEDFIYIVGRREFALFK